MRFFVAISALALFFVSCSEKKDSTQTEVGGGVETVAETSDVIDSLSVSSDMPVGYKTSKEERAVRLLKEFVQQKLKKYQHLTILGRVEVGALKLNKYVLLIDENGVVIDRALIASDGSFKFKKLPSGKYSVILELPNPGIFSEISMQVEDDSELLELPDAGQADEDQKLLEAAKVGDVINPMVISRNRMVEIPVDEIKNHKGKLKGIVLSNEKGNKTDNIILLLLDGQGKVTHKVKTNTLGEFAFEKLPSSSSVTILAAKRNKQLKIQFADEKDDSKFINDLPNATVKEPSPAVGTKLSGLYISANKLSTIPKDLFRDDICVLKGSITSSVVPAKDCELLLVDSDNKVVRKTFASEKGAFAFEKLPYGDYQLLVDDNKGGIKVNFSVESDDSDLKDVSSLNKSTAQDIPTLLRKNRIGQITIKDARNVTGFFYESIGKEKKGIANAEILLIDENMKTSANAKTDQSGNFHLDNLNKGIYNVVTSKSFGLLNIGLDIKYREQGMHINEH